MSYGLDLGELIQQYIWLFWHVHTYKSAWFGQRIPCAPSLMHWSATSLICGAMVWISALGVYLTCFSPPRSIYCYLKHPTYLYLLTHACLGVFNAPESFTNVHALVRECLGWFGAPLVHLGGIEVKSHHDTCTTSIGFMSLTNILQYIINVYYNIYKMYNNNMIS